MKSSAVFLLLFVSSLAHAKDETKEFLQSNIRQAIQLAGQSTSEVTSVISSKNQQMVIQVVPLAMDTAQADISHKEASPEDPKTSYVAGVETGTPIRYAGFGGVRFWRALFEIDGSLGRAQDSQNIAGMLKAQFAPLAHVGVKQIYVGGRLIHVENWTDNPQSIVQKQNIRGIGLGLRQKLPSDHNDFSIEIFGEVGKNWWNTQLNNENMTVVKSNGWYFAVGLSLLNNYR